MSDRLRGDEKAHVFVIAVLQLLLYLERLGFRFHLYQANICLLEFSRDVSGVLLAKPHFDNRRPD